MRHLRRLDPFSLYPTSLFIFVDYNLYIQLNINLITKYTKKNVLMAQTTHLESFGPVFVVLPSISLPITLFVVYNLCI